MEEALVVAGKLSQNAMLCDTVLYNAFRVILGVDPARSQAIYYAFEALSTKKQVINRLLNVGVPEDQQAVVRDLIAATQTSQNQRNELAHTLLNVRIEKGVAILTSLNPRHQEQSRKPISKPYLDGLMRVSTDAVNEAMFLYGNLCGKRGIPAQLILE
jgi:hypothetical protein